MLFWIDGMETSVPIWVGGGAGSQSGTVSAKSVMLYRPTLGFRRGTEFGDEMAICGFDEAAEWMREHFSFRVSTLHAECRRRIRARV